MSRQCWMKSQRFKTSARPCCVPLAAGPAGAAGFLGNLRQVLFQLSLRIAKLRVKMDTLHHDRLLLAMAEARAVEAPGFH